jgi:hypothetical protein
VDAVQRCILTPSTVTTTTLSILYEKIPVHDYLCTKDTYIKDGDMYVFVFSVWTKKFATQFEGL